MTFYELEKKCKERRRKKIIFFLVGILFAGIIGAGIYYLIHISKPTTAIKKTNPQKKENVKPVTNKREKEELKPIIDLNIKEPAIKPKEPVKIKKTKPAQKKEETSSVKKSSFIIETNSLPSFATCIALAKKYYAKKDYKNALKWAKYANIQNKKDPQSWIISAKSLYKMGKKKEALKVLNVYYSYTGSPEIKKLIEEMRR